MGNISLKSDVRQFIDENIQSYEELQVLLLMHAQPNKVWDVLDVAKDLRMEPFTAALHLQRLHQGKLISHEPSSSSFYEYQYARQPEEKEQKVSQLALAFDKARNEIVAYLYNREKTALGAFSNAFKVKKDE